MGEIPTLAGFSILFMTIGIVEALKTHFNVAGKWAFVAALAVGVLLSLATYVMQINPGIAPWIQQVAVGIVTALAASGYYDLYAKSK